uniref:Uncharacterized protein n=1 Tax=Chrysotila carterae TaxID=13221 RepID=A0A7S4BQB9_CHRCT
MVAPRSFSRPSVSTPVRAHSLTGTPPSPFLSSHKTLHMSPAHYQTYTTPLRTLSRLATITATSCVDAAASARALMHKLCMLLLTVFYLTVSVLSTTSSGTVTFGKNIQTALAERPAAFAAALFLAMPLVPLAFLTCSCTLQLTLITVTALPPAVYGASLELADVAAAWTPYICTVLCLLAAFAAAALVIKVFICVAIDIAGRAHRQLAPLFAVLLSLLRRAAQDARTSVLRAARYAAFEEPRLCPPAREHNTHSAAVAGIRTRTMHAARRTASRLIAPVSSLLRCVAHPLHVCVSHVARTCTSEEPRVTTLLRAHITQMFSTVHSIASQSLHTAFSPPALTASHYTAQNTDDMMSGHRPAHVRSATLFTRARAHITRHSTVLRFVCTLCLVLSVHKPVPSAHTSVSPALSSPHSLHAPASAAHQPAAASAAHASTPRIASPASPLSPLSRAATPPMSHNAAPTVAFHTVCTLAKHTSLVAPLAATLHNHTVSTPTDGPSCCTSLTAQTLRLTSTTAHLFSVVKQHRTAHICIGAATKLRAATLAALRVAIAATSRAAAHLTNFTESALQAIRATAVAAEPTAGNLPWSLRAIALSPGSRTTTRSSPTKRLPDSRKSYRQSYFLFFAAAACLLAACAATFVFSVAYAAAANLSPARPASPPFRPHEPPDSPTTHASRPHRQRGCRGGRRCHRVTTPTEARTTMSPPPPTPVVSDAQTQTLLLQPSAALAHNAHNTNTQVSAHTHTQPNQITHSTAGRTCLMRFSSAYADVANTDALLSRRAFARRRRNERRRQRFGTPIANLRLRDLRRAFDLELQPRRRRRRGRRRSRRNRGATSACPTELESSNEHSS